MKALADAVLWSSFGILALIAIATASAVAFATRAGLEAHHDIVALLHQMGAHSGFIARAFERHYFVSALGGFGGRRGCWQAACSSRPAGWNWRGWRRFPSCRRSRCI